MNLEWAYPLWLLLLPLVLLAVFLAGRRRPGAVPASRAGALLDAGAGASAVLTRLPQLLRALCLVAIVVALARPRVAGAVVEEETSGVPIVIAMDISSSMLAEDFRPRNRLEVGKETVAAFIESRRDPIGIVVFGAEALTLAPPTTHRAVLLNAVESLRVGLVEDGTAIGEGLATAANRLRRMPGESRVVILMSDGESNRGMDPLAAAQAAAAFGIRVYTIGIGSEGVAPVPVQRAGQGFVFAEVPVGIDEELLREIAVTTGGQYFRALDREALGRIYREIDQLVPSIVETRRHVSYREWYLLLLLIAGFALAGEWMVRGSRWGVVP